MSPKDVRRAEVMDWEPVLPVQLGSAALLAVLWIPPAHLTALALMEA